jgi:hypothetical protein
MLCLLLALLALPCLAAEMLPKSEAVTGWPARGEARTYTPRTLYECIDGAADLFLAYGFQGLTHGEYGADDTHLITVDVYDMGTPLHAFGVFSSERPPTVTLTALGQQGYVDSGLGAFWQDRYYVKVSIGAGATDAEARAFAVATASLLPPPSGMPAELKRLPAAARVAGSEGYTRQSALGHRFLQEVVSADYRVGKATAQLHLADLGTPATAAQGLKKLRAFETEGGAKPAATKGVGEEGFAVTDSSLGQFVAARKGRFLLLAFGGKATRAGLVQLVKEGAVWAR